MTAINAILQRHRGVLFTDGSIYTAQGTIVGFGDKAIAMPSLKAVIACRGNQKATGLLAMQFTVNYATYDDMIERVGDDLRDWHDDIVMHLGQYGFQDVEFVAVGWSDKQRRPVGFIYESKSGISETFDEISLSPMPEIETLKALALRGCNIAHVDRLDPVKHGIQIMEAQRGMKIMISDLAEEMHIVGGHIVATEITRDGISQRVIHRWVDEIGEPIQPSRDEPQPAATTTIPGLPMNRQQRRAAEREAAKARAA